jgi:hypothetical protein
MEEGLMGVYVYLRCIDGESVLEAGFVVVAAALVAGLGVLVGGRLAGESRRYWRHPNPPPSPGVVPAHRHQQLSASPR